MPLCGGEKTTQRKLVLLYVMPLLLALERLLVGEMAMAHTALFGAQRIDGALNRAGVGAALERHGEWEVSAMRYDGC